MDLSAPATLGLDAARAVDPAGYAIGGGTPRLALRPASQAEVAEALTAAASEKLGVVPWGGGTWLPDDPAPERYDLALDLTGLDRIVDYEPADMTITAECGVTLATLRATLAARGQELPLEGGHADRATLGGVLACNASGPRRLRFGAPYDRLLGARFALGDGTIARSGGRVVKNVAGYGIHRLLCGSRGGLAVLLEASLKLAPAPERRAMLEYEASATQIADAARWAWVPRLEPAGLSVVARGDSRFAISIGLEDEARWLGEQEVAVTGALGAPAKRVERDEVVARWQALDDAAALDGEACTLELVTPGNTPAALAPLVAAAPRARFVFHAPAGRLHLATEPSGAQELVHALGAAGFTLIAARGAEVAPALPPQVALRELRARVREALDPGRTFALGDRWAER